MKRFAELYRALDETNATSGKLAALVHYFAEAPPADVAWTVALLSGRRPRRVVPPSLLRAWGAEAAELPGWLFEECYQQVGDLAEVVSLLVPAPPAPAGGSLGEWIEGRLLPLRGQPADAQRAAVRDAWATLDERQRFVFNKIITGSFRVGASARLVTRALAEQSGVPADVIAHRLTGHWEPTAAFADALRHPDTGDADAGRPYPFALAHPLQDPPDTLGDPADWIAEWKWDGIRAQLLVREGGHHLWSRGDELLNGRFPEVETAARLLPPGTALDGELLPWRDGGPLPFALLQRRIGRQKLTPAILAEVPVALLAFDLLEAGGRDLRAEPLERRRAQLDALATGLPSGAPIHVAPALPGSWAERAALRDAARDASAEGLMLKRRTSAYGVGRRRGDWWKWKIDPWTMDAVLMYAQPGHGRRAGLFTDYTFGVWDGDTLVPVAKAYSGLTDAEIARVDRFVRRNTVDRFGPVRAVKPELVFELAFEGIQRSSRHKSGIAVRFPRMARWRSDKRPADADTLAMLEALLP